MKNINKLFETNTQCLSKLKIDKDKIIFKCYDEDFSGNTVFKILGFVNAVHKKYKNLNVPLTFYFRNIRIVDKLSYIIFECICYSLVKDYNHKVVLYWCPQSNILTDGVFCSPLNLLNDKSGKNLTKFEKSFKMDIYQRHFRRLINGNDNKNTNYLGNLLQELDSFLKYFYIAEDYRDQISEVITELVGNACEHGDTDCLLDVDITRDGRITIDDIPQKGIFYGINIAIVNFSDILLGDGIKNKINNNILNDNRYIYLKNAYNYHKQFFSEKYSYVDFCNISSLQDKISGRMNYSLSGGTGLTKLIYSLQEKSDADSCYVISGYRCVRFLKQLLNYDENNWLGFNVQKDFFNEIPDEEAIVKCYIYFPGTAYNLNFVMKREDT